MQPLIVEVAINGTVTKADNQHVPLTPREMVDCIRACAVAGASIVHMHAGDLWPEANGGHASAPYRETLAAVRESHPDLLVYPTLPASFHLTIQERFAHIEALAAEGLLRLVPIDPGTLNWGAFSPDGLGEELIYKNTMADVRYVFELCRKNSLACSMSIFEPGALQLVLAHRAHGSLPARSIIKFEFSAGRLLFGLHPNREGLDAYLSMLGDTTIPWMVNLREGDLNEGLGRLAIARGGHVRVGIEDYGGPRKPRNEELVQEIVALGRSLGRRPATPTEAANMLGQI